MINIVEIYLIYAVQNYGDNINHDNMLSQTCINNNSKS